MELKPAQKSYCSRDCYSGTARRAAREQARSGVDRRAIYRHLYEDPELQELLAQREKEEGREPGSLQRAAEAEDWEEMLASHNSARLVGAMGVEPVPKTSLLATAGMQGEKPAHILHNRVARAVRDGHLLAWTRLHGKGSHGSVYLTLPGNTPAGGDEVWGSLTSLGFRESKEPPSLAERAALAVKGLTDGEWEVLVEQEKVRRKAKAEALARG